MQVARRTSDDAARRSEEPGDRSEEPGHRSKEPDHRSEEPDHRSEELVIHDEAAERNRENDRPRRLSQVLSVDGLVNIDPWKPLISTFYPLLSKNRFRRVYTSCATR